MVSQYLDYTFNVTFVLGTVLVFGLLWISTRRRNGMPPGPLLLPLIGNLLDMRVDLRPVFKRLRRQYGDIFCVYVLNKPIIVLNGYEVIKETLMKNGDVFSERPPSFITDMFLGGKGLIGTSGEIWKEQRRFALNTLREFGMGRSILEAKIREEISYFLKTVEERKEPFDYRELLQTATSNVICSIIFGKRFDYNDPFFQRFMTALDEIFKVGALIAFLNVLPQLRYIPFDLFKFKLILQNKAFIDNSLIDPRIQESLKKTDSDESDSFISAYIKEMRIRQEKEPDTTMNVDNLRQVISDLFIAGTETTSTGLRWVLVLFMKYPDIQERCFQEIKETIGLDRVPSMKDKTSLPYVEATMTEVLRFCDIVPTNVPHSVSNDFRFRGFLIPKDVVILPFIDSVLHDESVWGDPENFRPERFLDEEGKFTKKEELIPFSIGRRTCLGESLARMELFLFMVSMIQRYKFVSPDGQEPSLEGEMGATHFPKPAKVKAIPR